MILTNAELAVAGLASAIVPIAIHLLSRRRRRPQPWAAMRFLLEAFRKHHRRVRMEQWFLLFLRCLILALVGLALAKPIVGATGLLGRTSRQVVYVVIDNGLTSGLTDDAGRTALSRHAEQAADVVGALDPGDVVGIITAARPVQALLLPPSADHVSVIRLLRSLTPAEGPCDLPGALTMLRNTIDQGEAERGQTVCYLFSEFRTGSVRLNQALSGSLDRDQPPGVMLLASPPAAGPGPNVRITSLAPTRHLMLDVASDLGPQVTVELARSGGELEAGATRVRLLGAGLAQDEPEILRWRPGQVQGNVNITFKPTVEGDREINLTAVIDDDRLAGDNKRHEVVELREHLRVLLVDRREVGFEPTLDLLSAGRWLERAIQPRAGGPIRVIRMEPAAMTPADLAGSDCIIVSRPDLLPAAAWSWLRTYVDDGGLLVITPPGEMNVHGWIGHLREDLDLPWQLQLEVGVDEEGLMLSESARVGRIMGNLAGDLPGLSSPVRVWRRLLATPEDMADQEALVLEDGSPLLLIGVPKTDFVGAGENARLVSETGAACRGLVLLLTVAPELSWTNLPSKPLMVPLVHEMIRQGLSEIRGNRRFRVGERPVLTSSGEAVELAGPDGRSTAMDETGRPQAPINCAGIHVLQDRMARRIETVAVNIDPDAGQTDPQSASAVTAWLSGSGDWRLFDPSRPAAALMEAGASSSPAIAIIILIVLLVLLETVLGRRFSYAYQEDVANVEDGLRPTIDDQPSGASRRLGSTAGGKSGVQSPGGRGGMR